jgi:hypothetical protein
LRGDAVAAELDGGEVRVIIGTLDASGGIRLADFQIANDLSLLIVQTTQERSRSEQTPKTSIRERRESTGN